ncbi:DUF6678 family protein [Collimonas sp. OK412]|uniref:DUF6678 family protein n=1 Tax=Collimonas sp. (strain OK412) TaxID=1801619 RepID=UPI00352B3B83
MFPVMNNTKWAELRFGMSGLDTLSPQFRVRNCAQWIRQCVGWGVVPPLLWTPRRG